MFKLSIICAHLVFLPLRLKTKYGWKLWKICDDSLNSFAYADVWILRKSIEFPAPEIYIFIRLCVTNRKVAGSIPDGINGIFHWHNPSDRSMALGSTQPLT